MITRDNHNSNGYLVLSVSWNTPFLADQLFFLPTGKDRVIRNITLFLFYNDHNSLYYLILLCYAVSASHCDHERGPMLYSGKGG